MLQGCLDREMHDTAVFALLVRTMPGRSGFFLAAGLESVVDFLEGLRFSRNLIEYLAQLRFTGKLDVMPGGTVLPTRLTADQKKPG